MGEASDTSLPSLPVHSRPLGRINEMAPIADYACALERRRETAKSTDRPLQSALRRCLQVAE